MVHQVTSGIKISVDHRFEGTFYKDYQLMYAFEYTITIENLHRVKFNCIQGIGL